MQFLHSFQQAIQYVAAALGQQQPFLVVLSLAGPAVDRGNTADQVDACGQLLADQGFGNPLCLFL